VRMMVDADLERLRQNPLAARAIEGH
jgi:hypothetical protein